MKIVWTEQAYDCLKEIYRYLSQNGSSLQGERFIEKIIEKGESLLEFHHRGRIVPELGMSDIRELLEGNYRIIYRITEKEIQIVSVFEGHQLLKEDFIPPENPSPKKDEY